MLNDVRFAKKTANRDFRVCALLVATMMVVSGLSGCAGLVSKANSDPSAPVAPSITAQPTNQTVTTGQTATFGVLVSGTAPMTYQWKKNGTAIAGAASSSYTTPATTSTDNGAQFAVTVTNSAGSVTSGAAVLTVNASTVTPAITAEPVSETVTVGQTATFNVAATGSAPLSYQWKKSGTVISGATSSTYTTPATTSADNGSQFTVVVSNTAGSVTSNAATLTVNAATVAPSITTQPISQSVTTGQTATFSVVAAGTAPLTYQWKKSGAAISGATSSTYTTPATTSADNGSQFTVTVTNSVGSVTSNAATLAVTTAAVAPTITTQPASKTVTAGQTATFSVVATGTAPLTYQWKKNSTAISGATSSSYTTPATTTADNGSQFTVVVTNTAGSVTSTAATLTVSAAVVAPSITTQPLGLTVTVGQTATFTVVATGTAPLTYQWKKGGTAISGATSFTYTTPTTTSGDNGSQFTVTVTNSAGSVTSSAATLTVNAALVAPSITTQPANKTVTAGQTATFSVVATGTAPLTYQWKKGGTAISGAIATSYTTPATTSADNGSQFTVVVTNSVGSVTSNPATLTVNPVVPPSVPTGLTATASSSSTISLDWNASTGSVAGYRVYRGGTQVATSTVTSYLDTGLTASTSYTYTVAAYDSVGDVSGQSASASATTLSASASCASGIPCALGWYQVPNTSLTGICPTYSDIQGNSGCAAVEDAWGSATVDNARNRLIIHGGGHVDYDGNEIYAIDFNANPIAPVLVKDASHGSGVDSAVAGCSEAFPDGTPNSRHDYSGFWYLPNQDVYFLYGAGIASCGNFSDGNWIYSPNSGAWTQLAPSTHPNTAKDGSIDLAAYNQTDGCLYFLENNLPAFWKQCYDNFAGANWTALAAPSGAPCDSTNGSSTIDVSRQLFVCVGGGSLYTIALSNSATVNDSSASGCSAAVSAFSPGIAYDPIQQLIVFWTGGSNVITYNASTHSCSTVTFSGGPGAQLANGTFNRFQYMPGIGAFVLANGMSSNVWTLRMVSPATAAADDFANRIALSSATASQGFDNAALFVPVTSGNGFYASGATTPPPTNPIGIQDTTTYRSGTSSVRFTIPGLSDDEPNGWYAQGYGFNLTAGSTVYFSFAQRMDSNYVTEKVPQKGGGFTYWKQFITSWWDGVNEFNSCGNPDFVFVNDFDEGFPLGYLQCGQDPLQISSSASPSGIFNEFDRQLITSGTWNGTTQTLTGGSLTGSGGAGYNCPYASTQPNPNCFDYPINVWVTYMCEIQMGTFGTASSTIECWVSTPTSPAWRTIIYEPNHVITQDQSNYTLNVLQLLPYWTDRDGTVSAGGTANTWYDEMIISQHPIPPPQAPPAAP